MKTYPVPSLLRRRQRGYALMLVLFFGGVGLLALAGALGWVMTNGTLIHRSNQHYRTVAAAEAATEKVLARMTRDFKNSGETTVYGNLSTYSALVPTTAENPMWGNFVFNNAQGGSGQTYVQRTVTETYVPLESQYSGLRGFASSYRVVSNARESGTLYNNVLGAVQQDIQFASIPIFQFAIFYNTDMELNGAATLHVRGRVHGNANLFTGSSSSQYFYEDVTVSGIISNGMRYGWSTNGTVYYYDTKESGHSQLNLPIGTNNTAAAVREVLQVPPAGELIDSAMGRERYYNKAELVVLVTDTNVTVGVKNPYTSSLTSIPWLATTNFISTNKTFTDQREGKLVLTTEIDVGKYITWAGTNATVLSVLGAGTPPNVLYVKDGRTKNSSKMTGVRLVNGQTLPSRGLTVATPNPLYTKGHYNQPNAAYLGTTNTSNTKPASLVSDAYTLLSGSFTDSASASTYTTRVASNTTVVAAIVTGNVLSTGDPAGTVGYSGGVNNLPRLLEHWSSKNYYLNGSLVCLFNSAEATAPFQNPGVYYSAPSRNINFDSNFLDASKLPPGTPALRALVRGKWVTPPANTTTYAGN
jgi:hypothetical protein